jgi:hypothetical protein
MPAFDERLIEEVDRLASCGAISVRANRMPVQYRQRTIEARLVTG